MTDNKTEPKKEEPKKDSLQAEKPQAEEPRKEASKPEKVEEPKAEEPKKEDKKSKSSPKLEKIVKEIEGLNALELADLASHLEEVFGVSAMPMAVAGGAPSASDGAGEAEVEAKSTYNVVLTEAGDNKLAVIKAVREVKPDLGLMDAKKLVESTPKEVLTGAKKDDAESAKKKIEDAGGKIELK